MVVCCRLQPPNSVDPQESVCLACFERHTEQYSTYVPYMLISKEERQKVVRLLEWDAALQPPIVIPEVHPVTSSKEYVPYKEDCFIISKEDFLTEVSYLDADKSIIDPLPKGYTPETYMLAVWDLALEAKKGE